MRLRDDDHRDVTWNESLKLRATTFVTIGVGLLLCLLVFVIVVFRKKRYQFGFRNRHPDLSLMSSIGGIFFLFTRMNIIWFDVLGIEQRESISWRLPQVLNALIGFSGMALAALVLVRVWLVVFKVNLAMADGDLAWISLVTAPVATQQSALDRAIQLFTQMTRPRAGTAMSSDSFRTMHTAKTPRAFTKMFSFGSGGLGTIGSDYELGSQWTASPAMTVLTAVSAATNMVSTPGTGISDSTPPPPIMKMKSLQLPATTTTMRSYDSAHSAEMPTTGSGLMGKKPAITKSMSLQSWRSRSRGGSHRKLKKWRHTRNISNVSMSSVGSTATIKDTLRHRMNLSLLAQEMEAHLSAGLSVAIGADVRSSVGGPLPFSHQPIAEDKVMTPAPTPKEKDSAAAALAHDRQGTLPTLASTTIYSLTERDSDNPTLQGAGHFPDVSPLSDETDAGDVVDATDAGDDTRTPEYGNDAEDEKRAEPAFKTAARLSGRPSVISLESSYHMSVRSGTLRTTHEMGDSTSLKDDDSLVVDDIVLQLEDGRLADGGGDGNVEEAGGSRAVFAHRHADSGKSELVLSDGDVDDIGAAIDNLTLTPESPLEVRTLSLADVQRDALGDLRTISGRAVGIPPEFLVDRHAANAQEEKREEEQVTVSIQKEDGKDEYREEMRKKLTEEFGDGEENDVVTVGRKYRWFVENKATYGNAFYVTARFMLVNLLFAVAVSLMYLSPATAKWVTLTIMVWFTAVAMCFVAIYMRHPVFEDSVHMRTELNAILWFFWLCAAGFVALVCCAFALRYRNSFWYLSAMRVYYMCSVAVLMLLQTAYIVYLFKDVDSVKADLLGDLMPVRKLPSSSAVHTAAQKLDGAVRRISNLALGRRRSNSEPKKPLLTLFRKMMIVIKDEDGYRLFMKHLFKEFSNENLLAVYEFMQFRNLAKNDDRQHIGLPLEAEVDEKWEEVFAPRIVSEVQSSIVFHPLLDIEQKFLALVDKYVTDSSEMTINVSYGCRRDLIDLAQHIVDDYAAFMSNPAVGSDGIAVRHTVFDAATGELFHLMQDSFKRFSMTVPYISLRSRLFN